jgi:hypothetical protein
MGFRSSSEESESEMSWMMALATDSAVALRRPARGSLESPFERPILAASVAPISSGGEAGISSRPLPYIVLTWLDTTPARRVPPGMDGASPPPTAAPDGAVLMTLAANQCCTQFSLGSCGKSRGPLCLMTTPAAERK